MRSASRIFLSLVILFCLLASTQLAWGSERIRPEPHMVEPSIQEGESALELTYVAQFQLIWYDLGSGADMNGAYWKPVVPEGYYALGHYGKSGWDAPWGGMFAARELEYGALAPPIDYVWIWDDDNSGGVYDGAFWKPVPPAGYVCLGDVAINIHDVKPSLNEIRCVREDLVTEGTVGPLIWWDKGSGAYADFSSWYVTANDGGIGVGAFVGQGFYDPPPDSPVYVLRKDRVLENTPSAELELKYVDDFEFVWWDKGSGADYDGSFYRPVAPQGYYPLGHFAQWNYDTSAGPAFVVREIVPGSGALAPPVGYNLIWKDENSGADLDGSFWEPIPPPGYVCLGIVVQQGWTIPSSLDLIRCVREDLTVLAKDGGWIWDDRGSGAVTDIYAYSIIPVQNDGLYLGTFTANPGNNYTGPLPDILFGLDPRAVSIEDNLLSEAEVVNLIEQYGPKLYLHSDEDYFMDDPNWSLDNNMYLGWAIVENETQPSEFEEEHPGQIPTSAQTLLTDVDHILTDIKPYEPYDNSPFFRIYLRHSTINHGNMGRGKAYIHIIPWNTFFTEIQFWFFYPYNGPGRVRICTTSCSYVQLVQNGRHYGDWEHVTLRFLNSNKELVGVYLSAHNKGYWFTSADFDNLLMRYDTHPIIFSAKYSHAHYPTAGIHFYKRLFNFELATGDIYDLTDYGYMFETYLPDNYTIIASELHPALEPDWLQFRYRWGQYEFLQTKFLDLGFYDYTYYEIGAGPMGPAMKYAWNRGDLADVIGWPEVPYNVDWNFTFLPVISTDK